MFYGNAQSTCIIAFVRNLLAILMGFYITTVLRIKSSFDKTKYIFDQSF